MVCVVMIETQTWWGMTDAAWKRGLEVLMDSWRDRTEKN